MIKYYKVTTDKGSYKVGVETPDEAPETGGAESTSSPISQAVGSTMGAMIPGVGPLLGGLIGKSPATQQAIGSAISAPVRGWRGIGVGTQRLIEGDNASAALQRASAAVQPGYQPQSGEKIGAIAGSALPFAPLGIMSGAAAVGTATGAESLAAGRPAGEALMEGAGTGAATALFGGALKGGTSLVGGGLRYGGQFLEDAYRSIVASAKGTKGGVIDLVFDAAQKSPETVKQAAAGFFRGIGKLRGAAQGKMAAAENMPVTGPLADDAAREIGQRGADLSKALRQEAFKLSQEAAETLDNNPNITRQQLIEPLEELKKSLEIKAGKSAGVEVERARATLGRWAGWIEELTGGSKPSGLLGPNGKPIPGGPPINISQVELKKLVQNLGNDIEFSGPADEPAKKVLRPAWNRLNALIKENTDYLKKIEPVNRLIKTADELEGALALERKAAHEIAITDRTAGAVKSILKGNKQVSEETVQKLGFSDIIKSARNREIQGQAKEAALKEAQRGLKVRYPSEANVMTMAEAAARQGPGSGAYTRLQAAFSEVLGPTEGPKVARDAMTSAAKEIAKRGGGSTFKGLSILGLASSPLRRVGVDKLKLVDEALRRGIKAGYGVSRFSRKIPSRGMGSLGYILDQQGRGQ